MPAGRMIDWEPARRWLAHLLPRRPPSVAVGRTCSVPMAKRRAVRSELWQHLVDKEAQRLERWRTSKRHLKQIKAELRQFADLICELTRLAGERWIRPLQRSTRHALGLRSGRREIRDQSHRFTQCPRVTTLRGAVRLQQRQLSSQRLR